MIVIGLCKKGGSMESGISVIFKTGIFVGLFLVFSSYAVDKAGKKIEKKMLGVYAHKGDLSHKYVFLFDEGVTCQLLDNKEETNEPTVMKKLNYFVPSVLCKGADCNEMVEKVNKLECKDDHCIRVVFVDTPLKGISFEIMIHPEKRNLIYKIYSAVGGKRGISFEFYNRFMLRHMKLHADATTIRRYAFLEKSKSSFYASRNRMLETRSV